MPATNIDVTRRLFESYGRADYAAAPCLVPDVVHEVGEEMPALGPVHHSARGRGNGIEHDERPFDVLAPRAGKCLRKREFKRRSEALGAAGIEE